eukprot:scaffold262573_cov48-Prasinocladus_malaysianus.AAC.1
MSGSPWSYYVRIQGDAGISCTRTRTRTNARLKSKALVLVLVPVGIFNEAPTRTVPGKQRTGYLELVRFTAGHLRNISLPIIRMTDQHSD